MIQAIVGFETSGMIRNTLAALPAAPVGVTVKPLGWFEVEKYRYGGKYTSEGYTIRYIEGFFMLDFAGSGKTEWRLPTIEAAKAAAQADYTARILAALEPPTHAALDAAEARERQAVEGVPHLRDTEGHWGDFVLSALNEAEKAMRKFPQPNYVISKVAEEAGEVVKASIHCAEGRETAENVRGEMRQLIAMLYRLWVEGDQVHGLPPISAVLPKGGEA